ncbi:MAG TPA: HAMP domain-containing sensor histidine kinase [Mycobacteriales bacterium]|nr:HAMP domain-containing sensor histidine kinase [Mycobacteriales bacterium]
MSRPPDRSWAASAPGPAGPGRAQPGTPGGRGTRRRPTLQYRTAQVTIAVAAVAVLVAGVVLLGLVRSAADSDARRTLGALADAAADASDRPGRLAPSRTRAQLTALKVDFAFVTRQGAALGGPPDGLAARALTPAEAAAVVGGQSLSLTRDIGGTRALVEARPAGRGGLVLAQPLSEAAPLHLAVLRIGLALLIGLSVAAAAGIVLARLLARPLRRAAEAAHALAGGARDVRVPPEGPAEVAEVADSLNTLSTALTTSEGRQREFLLSVSHELRTPLTAITGFAESLADGVTTGEDVRPVGQTVLGEARRLDRLVSDLLDLARLGAQDFRIDRQPVDLTALVASAADVWRARCDAVGVAFHAELPPRPLVTVTDPTRVRQVLDGLAENALRVTPAGAPVVLALYAAPGAAVLQVRDGGPGLTTEDCAVAFERSVLYERYRGVRQVGTGVGLALVHGLTTRLGGTAAAGRAAEGGACFTVRLPLVAGRASAELTVPLRTLSGGATEAVRPGR